METGPRLKVSSDKLVKPGIEPATPGLPGKRFIHYTTAAPNIIMIAKRFWNTTENSSPAFIKGMLWKLNLVHVSILLFMSIRQIHVLPSS